MGEPHSTLFGRRAHMSGRTRKMVSFFCLAFASLGSPGISHIVRWA